jgi:hypothetical protein
MPALFRHDYTPDELDNIDGETYIPTYANPGSINADSPESTTQRYGNGDTPGWAKYRCRAHDVQWATGGCWVCVLAVSIKDASSDTIGDTPKEAA